MTPGSNRKLAAAALWLGILICLTPVSAPAETAPPKTIVIDADAQYRFAGHTFSIGDYSRAVGEYQRFRYFFPDDPRAAQALFRIGESHFKNGDYLKSIEAFNQLIAERPDSGLAPRAYLMISECYRNLKAYGQAVITLNNLLAVTDDSETRDRAYYKRGWLYVESAAWDQARASFAAISGQRRLSYGLDKLESALLAGDQIPRKDPATAGFLAVVPGAGHLYCGRKRDALIAFGLNAGLILAAVEAFKDDNVALGGLLAVVGAGFYSGSIYSAISSAHKYNRTKTQDFIDRLKQNLQIRFSAAPHKGRFMLGVQSAF